MHTWKLLFSGPSSKSLQRVPYAQTGLMFNCSSKFLEMVSGIHRIASSGTYNLGQNKMNCKRPSHPNQGWSRARAKTRHFPILDLGGGGEGRSRFSILGTSPPVSECGYRNPINFCSITESGIRETFACGIRSLVKVQQLQLKNKSD